MNSLFISAAHKSSGKTIFSIGLTRLLSDFNYNVQAFKKGPDYIDPSWLTLASRSKCYNLDFNTQTKSEIKNFFESKFTAPHFYLSITVDMDNAISSRKAINAKLGHKISFNDIIVKASAMSLREHPTVNSSWRGDVIRRNEHVNVGVAVAVEEGLLVPVVRYTDTKTLSEISKEVKAFAQGAKEKKLQPSI